MWNSTQEPTPVLKRSLTPFEQFSEESLSCPWKPEAGGETDFAALKIDVGV